jgi:hypothetical protein
VVVNRSSLVRGAAAGALAAGVWALQQPLDKRLFRSDYDDVELIGKLVTRRPLWPVPGAIIHLGNGAAFGATYALVQPRLPGPSWARGVLAAQIEHLVLWPLGRLTDRYHPARRELTPLTGNRRAFAQATWRHALFGLVLGEVEARARGNRRARLPTFSNSGFSCRLAAWSYRGSSGRRRARWRARRR